MFDSLKNGGLVALGAVLLAVAIDRHELSVRLEESRTTIAEKDSRILSFQSAIEQMEQTSKDKDDIVTLFRQRFSEADKLERERVLKVEQALKDISSKVERNVSLSNKLLSSTPQSDDMCLEANALINAYLDEIRAGE